MQYRKTLVPQNSCMLLTLIAIISLPKTYNFLVYMLTIVNINLPDLKFYPRHQIHSLKVIFKFILKLASNQIRLFF